MNNKLVVTVTSARGQPSFVADASADIAQLRDIVQNRFGLQDCGDCPAIPHSFCAGPVPPVPPLSGPATISLLSQRRHLRAI